MEVESKNLRELFEDVGRTISSSEFEDERDVKKCYVKILRVLTVAYELKNRIHQVLVTSLPLSKYEQDVARLVSKGFAYEERKKWMELQSDRGMMEFGNTIREADEFIEACKRYESILNGILNCQRLGVRLSFEGHQ